MSYGEMSVFHLTKSRGRESIPLLSVQFRTRRCRISFAFYVGNMDYHSLCCKIKEDMAMSEILCGFGMLPTVSARCLGKKGKWGFLTPYLALH